MIHLTPQLLVFTYEALRETQPFKRWGLPHSDEVAFTVSKHPRDGANFWRSDDGDLCIAVSGEIIGRLDSLIPFMAHELVHMRLLLEGDKDWAVHGKSFKAKAREVCRAHEFDYKLFI